MAILEHGTMILVILEVPTIDCHARFNLENGLSVVRVLYLYQPRAELHPHLLSEDFVDVPANDALSNLLEKPRQSNIGLTNDHNIDSRLYCVGLNK